MIPQLNEAELNDATPHAAATAATSLEMCMQGCKTAPLDKCTYWTWIKTNSTCLFRGLLKITGGDTDRMDAVTGEKYCTGESKQRLLATFQFVFKYFVLLGISITLTKRKPILQFLCHIALR